MENEHPTRKDLRRYLAADLSPREGQWIENHLRTAGCATCLFLARNLLQEAGPDLREAARRMADSTRPEEEREEELQRAMRQTYSRAVALQGELHIAPALLTEIERRPPETRRETIRTAPRYQLFGFAEYLCEESLRAGFRDVVRAVELAELAREVADRLDPRIYLATIATDRQALTRAYLGNAWRVASDLVKAEQHFQDGLLLLEKGTASPLVRAELLSLLGSLRIDQVRYREARRVLNRALETYRKLEWRRLEGKVLLKLANAEGYAGEAEKAVAELRKAHEIIEGEGDDRLLLNARHSLAFWLVDTGDSLEALAQLEKAQPLYDEFLDDPWVQLRRGWLRARIFAGLGDLDMAQRAFEEVRHTALERELPYEVAMISLEEAIVHLNRGEMKRVRELAEEMVPILRSQELHGHALAAVYLFQQAAFDNTATVDLARQVLNYLQRARNNRYFRFHRSRRKS